MHKWMNLWVDQNAFREALPWLRWQKTICTATKIITLLLQEPKKGKIQIKEMAETTVRSPLLLLTTPIRLLNQLISIITLETSKSCLNLIDLLLTRLHHVKPEVLQTSVSVTKTCPTSRHVTVSLQDQERKFTTDPQTKSHLEMLTTLTIGSAKSELCYPFYSDKPMQQNNPLSKTMQI